MTEGQSDRMFEWNKHVTDGFRGEVITIKQRETWAKLTGFTLSTNEKQTKNYSSE